jgi:hypothetical protein
VPVGVGAAGTIAGGIWVVATRRGFIGAGPEPPQPH